jgi:hypothetical protein
MRNYAYFTENKGVWDRHKILTNQDILTIMATKVFRWNSKPIPALVTVILIMPYWLVIEKITGMTYQDAMEKIIFKPLGMKDTMYDYKKDKKLRRLLIEQIFLINMNYLDAIYGDKNIYSTPRDLLKFDDGRKFAQIS